MSTVTPSADKRTHYDEESGVLRSVFGAELFEAPSEKAAFEKSGADFLDANKTLFNLDDIDLEEVTVQDGKFTQSIQYAQRHNGIPVYAGRFVVGRRKRDGHITSAVNRIEYDLPAGLNRDAIRFDAEQALDQLRRRFSPQFASLIFGTPQLFVYRYQPAENIQLPIEAPPIRSEMLELGDAVPGAAYLVWQIYMDTTDPDGNWEILFDAIDGTLVAVFDRRMYATRKGYVFWPDPIRSAQDNTLRWSTPESTLNNQRVEVDLENLNPPSGGKYKLEGSWVRTVEREAPTNAPPETTSHFKFGAKEADFLNVMAYFYVDNLVRYLRNFGVTAYNNAVTGPIDVDAQGFNSADNSHFVVPVSGTPYIGHGEGGVPDASDPGVIVHEYGHALHYFILGSHSNSSYEEGFNDFLAACWLDRFNVHQFEREEVFPWDNNPGIHWDPTRRVDRTERFDDSSFGTYGFYFRGSIWATALWDLYLNIGGNASNAAVRNAAADAVIHTYLEMLVAVDDNQPPADLANGLITADDAKTGGLYKKVIWDAFRRRGLWSDFTPTGNIDLYIRDSAADTGEHASPEIHWQSPDIWVRNNPPPANPADPTDPNYGEDPNAGHQNPINNVPNYLYVNVHNRGSQPAPANTFTVEAFNCNPGTGMLWPTHFNSVGTLTITNPIPAGGHVRVGPFIWTPQIVDHECLLAVVHGTADPAITKTVLGTVDHWRLVRFDNNVGQRNVTPQNAVPGGKTKTSFFIRGSTVPTVNTLRLDALALPADTDIQVRVARSMLEDAAGFSGMTVIDRNSRWATFSLPGGAVGVLEGFPLTSFAERTVTVEIDFSYAAEHLARYPLAISQEQNGVVAGQLTIEITAVKESEDYVYGNPRSGELHTIHCPFWSQISQHNKHPYATIQAGLARGYNGCAFCLPEYNTG